jgi:hypothetical protein
MTFKIIFVTVLLVATSSYANDELINELPKEVEQQYPNAIIITEKDFSAEVRENARPQNVISGDFDCNGSHDTGLQIYHEGRIKLVAIHRFKNERPKVMEIERTGEWSLGSIRGHYEKIIKLKKKGSRVTFFCECGNNNKGKDQELCKKYADSESPKGCSFTLNCDAIEWIYYGKAAQLFYFDKKDDKYLSVITED